MQRESGSTRCGGVLVAALAAAAFAVRFQRLLESPHPLGTDGYYYVVQLEHWWREGRLHVPDASWVLRFLALFGLKVGAALLAAACVPAAWLAGARLERLRAGDEPPGSVAPCAAAAWMAASPTLMFMTAEFPKQLGAAAPSLALLAWAIRPRRGLQALVGLALFLLAATAHRAGAALVLASALGAGIGWLSRGVTRRPRWLPLALAGGALFAALTAFLPGLLHPADWERLKDARLSWPSLPQPLAVRGPELLLAWAALPLGLAGWLTRPSLRPVLGALLLPLCVCLAPAWGAQMSARLLLLAPVAAAPLWVVSFPRRWTLALPARGLAAVALLATVLSRWGADPRALPPYERFERLIGKLPRPLPELLIAHQGLSFFYDHVTGKEAMAWAPEPELDFTRVGRIAWGIRDEEWMAYATGGPAPVRLDAAYTFVREDVWARFRGRALAEGDDDLQERLADWRNPSRVRSAALKRNRAPATAPDARGDPP